MQAAPSGGRSTAPADARVLARDAAIAGAAPTTSLALPGTAQLVWLGGLMLDLALLLVVIHQFQLVSRSFFHVAILASAGCLVSAALPARHRLRFFAALSVASLGVAFGVTDGVWLLALGLALLGTCHLPIRLGVRVLLLLAVGAVLGVMRAGVIAVPWSGSIWPILGSMFMFRIALYLHALKHGKVSPSLTSGAAYFFMLPNVCFPLFPVVDYTTFMRTHNQGDLQETHRTGISWMVRGLFHLILYRLVYLHLAVDPADITDLGGVVQHLLSTFLLYLRVSGEFHLIVGMLHLYGFRLPETHRLYYLASSFTDFWRRINIYWKDFMMKLVYYPSFFRVRHWGATRALIVSTIIVFIGTWLLHSYQWFWLRGDFPLTLADGLFWGLLGGLVVVNAVREARRGRDRSLGRQQWSGSLALRTVGTFIALCVLWSLWSAESVSRWVWMWTAAQRVETVDLLWITAVLALGFAIAGRNWGAPGLAPEARSGLWSPILRTRLLLVTLVLAGSPQFVGTVSADAAPIIASLQTPRLNARDEGLQHRGYYERMDNVDRLSSQLWEAVAQRPADWKPLSETEAWRAREDFLGSELRASASILFYGLPFTVNQWGMRDREYPAAKPPGVFRIALLGPSIIMGAGAADGETIGAFLEGRLQQAFAGSALRFEVLNFGISNLAVTQQAPLLEENVLRFDPDVILIADSPRLQRTVVNHLLAVLYRRAEIPYPPLRDIIEDAGADALAREGRAVPFELGRSLADWIGMPARMPWNEAEVRLRLAADDIVAWSLAHIAQRSREAGAKPVFALMDVVREPDTREVPALSAAEHAGMTVLDLRDVYDAHEPAELRVAEWDKHPNARGNEIIAERLFLEFQRAGLLPGAQQAASGPVQFP